MNMLYDMRDSIYIANGGWIINDETTAVSKHVTGNKHTHLDILHLSFNKQGM